jgi:hypothetical protein
MAEPLRWYDEKNADNPPWVAALADVRRLATREGYCFQHVQVIIVAIDQCREGTRQPGLFPQQAVWHRRRNEGSPSLIILITNICHGIGCVCENQPEQAWDKEIGCDCGAGMPCKCNSGEEPDISQVIEENPPPRH